MRYNPVLREWVIIAERRRERPKLEKEGCPFCGDINSKGVISLPNKYPSLIECRDFTEKNFYEKRAPSGICEVLLYTRKHDLSLASLSIDDIGKVVHLWKDRYVQLSKKQGIKYIFIFENRGKEIGVTLTHPHGQLYAFSFIPPIIERELGSSLEYFMDNHSCLFCDIIQNELKERSRIVFENHEFLAFVPFYANWSYEVHIYPKKHEFSLSNMEEAWSLAECLKKVLSSYEIAVREDCSYILAVHSQPIPAVDHYHFHIEIYPPYSVEGMKYRGGVETGVGTFINALSPEDSAKMLRSAIRKLYQ